MSADAIETARLLGEMTSTLKSVSSDIAEIKTSLNEGNKKFEEHNKQLQEIKLECATRGVTCPALHGTATQQTPTNGVPWKYIGTGIVFVAASFYGLIVLVAKAFKIDLPWPF